MSHILIFCVVKLYRLVVATNVSDENIASTFRVENGAVFSSEMLCVGNLTTLYKQTTKLCIFTVMKTRSLLGNEVSFAFFFFRKAADYSRG
jgi:hypothetical protein